jgi:hypothetical protein
MKSFYLAPAAWDSSNYRDVYTREQIDQLPDDWNADADDCDYLGEFGSVGEAIAKAKQNYNFARDMRN